MNKVRVGLALDPGVLADIDTDAEDAGVSRSSMVEMMLREAHQRRMLARTRPPADVPAPRAELNSTDGLRDVLAWQAGA